MRLIAFLSLIVVFLSFPVLAQEEEPIEFAGIPWGSTPEQVYSIIHDKFGAKMTDGTEFGLGESPLPNTTYRFVKSIHILDQDWFVFLIFENEKGLAKIALLYQLESDSEDNAYSDWRKIVSVYKGKYGEGETYVLRSENQFISDPAWMQYKNYSPSWIYERNGFDVYVTVEFEYSNHSISIVYESPIFYEIKKKEAEADKELI